MKVEEEQREVTPQGVPRISIPTYREILAYKKLALVLLAIWHPERDKNNGDGS
jgi:hypothetical protein